MSKVERMPLPNVESYLKKKYPEDFSHTHTYRNFIEQVYRSHLKAGLGDATFERNFLSDNNFSHWQRLSEVLFAHELLEACLDVSSPGQGPDFCVIHEGQKIWIEVICPEPTGIPVDWLEKISPGDKVRVVSMPHEAILLRWTAAIKEKTAKLLGAPGRPPGYLKKGWVGPEDAYVIAINSRLLRGAGGSSLFGISQFPFAAEAVFPFGPFAINLDRTTLKKVSSGHVFRPVVMTAKGAPVETSPFLNSDFEMVSAIWAADFDGTEVIGNGKPLVIVHNPNAKIPVPQKLLPSFYEYVATRLGDEEYCLNKTDGSFRTANSDSQSEG